MATFKVKLSNVTVRAYEPPQLPLEALYITGATATYTVSIFGTSIGYYLQDVTGGKRINQLQIGNVVVGDGIDEKGETVIIPKSICVDAGDPAAFQGGHEFITPRGDAHIHIHMSS